MHVSSPATDGTHSSLLARARTQDEQAWAELFKWIGPFVLRWCQKAGLQAADCEDVGQEVLQKVCGQLSTFRKDKPGHSFRGWVYTITRNCVSDLRRRRGPQTVAITELPAEPEPSEANDLKRRALSMILQDIIGESAADAGFMAFYRVSVDGLSAPEAAREMGLEPANVRQHCTRWRRRLREQLQERFGELLG